MLPADGYATMSCWRRAIRHIHRQDHHLEPGRRIVLKTTDGQPNIQSDQAQASRPSPPPDISRWMPEQLAYILCAEYAFRCSLCAPSPVGADRQIRA
jgi:hypothetical protein